ncbi:AmmeMemoRadiSam system protein A [bacterium (Candidatus Blackallbacteria) CG17_big_fil_post_rev_8_21_14_2_50_48_46]|uniref:AmmeMemoRadiSam system protein A n=1 Tax=bacterium (Candidatus Blackallbacteria) CG17_big_fil_post_rev_8_21_14_2_50_48_46 TaxID=2014261 RepID=A0A2M7G3H2_9BACT|nr:MAG: AmmeMemoRadiSam system protein A [bacterium (Candidatus Blackallbacteria) CG18_big_fil_WC_8_21_14_2_50_49_26]PIW16423.1 MAG: AmmeMemoRadiSam system protein A [bacterium (Candidatus Blackallbacteria) CG17_big_fil_post_rev_8_21_14_2_50_48_46]PIW45931.1 MAG: AmmeMemoRadiSam system protein A [bacterium (Candidatus Blackallbacteria) CG13_big_fil_rev_8_21_14_2_50_49_14]
MSLSPQTLPELARLTIENYVSSGELPQMDLGALADFQKSQAGVFVTIYHQPRGQRDLRGCIGTIGPTQANILEETIQNAISAALRDPRFSPVSVSELSGLSYEVSVLHEPEPIASLDLLNVDTYGVIVVNGSRRGLLLPGIESIRTVEEQVLHAMYKGGIRPGEPVSLFRFQVDKYV